MKSKVLPILQWIFVGFCFLSMIAMGLTIYGFMMLALTVISMPIKPMKEIGREFLKTKQSG